MTDRTVESRLSSIETKLDHTNKTVDRLLPLIERVVRLEERQGALNLLPGTVAKNQVDGAVSHAVQDERDRGRDELRKNMVLILGVASFVASVVSIIGGAVVSSLLGG